MVATAIIGSAVVGAGATVAGAGAAAGAQRDAANRSADTQMQMYERTRADLSPYMAIGQEGANRLVGNLDRLTAPITMDQAALEQTPGYQFNLKQGLRAVQNSATARGLGISGAAMKGAAQYATGLADNTYQQQFNNAVTNQTNAFNRLMGVTQLGQSSAAGVGAQGTQTASNVGNALIGGGNATAAAYNSIGPAVTNAGNGLTRGLMYQNMYGNNFGSGGGFGSTGTGLI